MVDREHADLRSHDDASRRGRPRAIDDPRVVECAEEYLSALRAGRKPDRQALLRQFPEIASELAECLDALELVERAQSQADLQAGERDEAQEPEEIPQPVALGDFRIVREIGRGGMGVVYEAEQLSLRRRVALKVLPFAAMLDPKQLQRFKNEAQAAAQLHHQNIVPVYFVGCERGVHFYAMQYVEGQTLAQVVADLQRLEAREGKAPDEEDQPGLGLADSLTAGQFEPPRGAADAGAPTAAYGGEPTPAAAPPVAKETAPVAAISTERSAKSPAFFRSVARLGAQAAEALDYAHREGVVHRDVKPSNLILDHRGKIWVTDFGLARIESDPGLTMSGDILGTIRYMSPEQALAKRVVVDHRTDVYSLGVTLYELLTLRPAYSGTDRQELLRQIAFEEPQPPRRLNKAIPAELETIVLKATIKNPAERYATAEELADDLRRFLEDKPIRAQRPTWVQRVAKWSRRHKPIVASAAIMLVLTTIGLAVSNILIAGQRNRAEEAVQGERQQRKEVQRQRDKAQRLREIAEQNFYLAEMRQAQHDWADGPVSRLQRSLLHHVPAPGGRDLRQWEWYYFLSLLTGDLMSLRGIGQASVCWTSDGKRLVTTGGDETAKIWDPATRRLVSTLYGHTNRVSWVAISPDDQRLATASEDKTIKIWDLATGKEVCTLAGHSKGARWVGWSAKGKALASASWDGTVKIWDPAAQRALATLPAGAHVAWCPDGRRLAVGGNPHVTIWDAAGARQLHNLNQEAACFSLAWSPDGRRIATSGGSAGSKPSIKVWDAKTGEEILAKPRGDVFQVAWDPSGSRLASASWSQWVGVWDVNTGELLNTLRGHQGSVDLVAWSHDGTRLASGSRDQSIRIWDAASGEQIRTLRGHTSAIRGLSFSPDDRHLASWSFNELKIWDIDQGPSNVLGGGNKRLHYSTPSWDGQSIVTASEDETIDIWDTTSGQKLRTLPRLKDGGIDIGTGSAKQNRFSWSPDGRHIAWARTDGVVRIWDALTKDRLRLLRGHPRGVPALAWSKTGRRLASASQSEIRIWDTTTGEELLAFEAHRATIVALSWSRQRLASGAWDGTVRIWDPTTGRLLHILAGHDKWIASLAWSPDGRLLASAGFDHTVRIWDAAAGKAQLSLPGHTSRVWSLAWHPSGRRLASFAGDHSVRIWDTVSGQQIISLHLGELFDVGSVAWTSDGRHLVLVSRGGAVEVWDASKGYELAAGPVSSWAGRIADVTPSKPVYQDELVAAWNYHNSGLWEKKAKRPQEALRWFRKELELRMTIPERQQDYVVWSRLGQALYRLQRWEEARQTLEQAVARRGDAAPTLLWGPRWWYLTMTLAQLGQKDKARFYYDRLVEQLREEPEPSETDSRLHDEAAELLGIDEDPDREQESAEESGSPGKAETTTDRVDRD